MRENYRLEPGIIRNRDQGPTRHPLIRKKEKYDGYDVDNEAGCHRHGSRTGLPASCAREEGTKLSRERTWT